MIRKIGLDDLDQVMKIEEDCFHEQWSRDMYRYEILDNEFKEFCGYEKDGRLVALIDYWILFESCQLANLAVLACERKQGFAKKLMEYMILAAEKKCCEVITLEVRKSNMEAISLYERFGFMEINVRKQYYRDLEDAIVMAKALGGGIV